MARKHNLSPEIAQQLAQMAREMRVSVYGPDGYPVWGTKFIEIEDQGMEIGHELARVFMEQSVATQAQVGMPEAALAEQGGEVPERSQKDHESKLETPAGEVEWDQPKARLKQARRDFFPSGQGFGD